MKNITILILVISFVSCKKERLELDPISFADGNEFYTNDQELNQAAIAIYDGLQEVPLREFALTEMRSDNTGSGSAEGIWGQFESFDILTNNIQVREYWTANYNVIFRANRVLGNLQVVSQADLKTQLEGEAKFTRALAHFNLVRAYGDIPILDREISYTERDYYVRDSKAEVYNFIIQDLIDASSLLPSKANMTFGRATSGAAQSLLAKVYLNTGAYSQARTLLESVMNSGSYELESNYRDVFYTEENDEIIFAIPYKSDNLFESQDFSFEMTGLGSLGGLNEVSADFLGNLRPADSVRAPILLNPSATGEVGKFITSSTNARLGGNDWIVLRLADVYLMHVESIMAGLPSTQNIEAIESFNKVRERAGQSIIPTNGSGEISLQLLLNERRIELAFENHRFYDLVRTGQAIQTLSRFAQSQGTSFTTTDLLLPIPLAEINVSQGLLTQNPGY